jgi:hypothetical protein
LVYYELIVLGFNDELRKKVSGDVGPMMELIKDSGINDLMMKNGDDELLRGNGDIESVILRVSLQG